METVARMDNTDDIRRRSPLPWWPPRPVNVTQAARLERRPPRSRWHSAHKGSRAERAGPAERHASQTQRRRQAAGWGRGGRARRTTADGASRRYAGHGGRTPGGGKARGAITPGWTRSAGQSGWTNTIVFFKDNALNIGIGSLSHPATVLPIAAGVNLATPFTASLSPFFAYGWTGPEPPGTYVFFVAALNGGNLVAFSTAAVTFSP